MGRAAVVGGGMLGLAVARELHGRGEDVTILEAEPEIGGRTASWQAGEVTWDRSPHVVRRDDVRTRELLAWAGLERELVWRTARTGFYAGEAFGVRPASSTWELLRLPTIGALDGARIGATIMGGSRIKDAVLLEDIPAGDWLRARSGGRAFDRFWVPLLRARLGPAWTETSAAFVWALLRRHATARRTGRSEECYGYVLGGRRRILGRLAQRLAHEGVKLVTGSPVIAVQSSGGSQVVVTEVGSERFDRVVVTTPAPVAARLCLDLTPEERRRLRAVRYQGMICASMVVPEPLAGFYLTYVTDPRLPFTAVVEMTALADPAELAGRRLVYLPKFVSPEDPLFEASDDEIRYHHLRALQRIHPHFDPSSVEAFRVEREPYACPVPTLGYSRTMPPTTTSVPELQLVGSAHVPYAALDVDDTLALVGELR